MAERHLVGRVGVDSAQLIICDPSYIPGQEIYQRWREMQENQLEALQAAQAAQDAAAMAAAYPLWYRLDYTLGHEGAAVIAHSGIGDGFYPVYAWVEDVEGWGERVVRLEVDFMDHVLLETAPIEPPDGLERLLGNLVEFLELFPTENDNPTNQEARTLLLRTRRMLEFYQEQKKEE